jgi:hypothetical protein
VWGCAVGVAGVREQIVDRDAVVVHAPDDGHDLTGRVVPAARDLEAADEFGDLRAALV